jgi:hypothetical protein
MEVLANAENHMYSHKLSERSSTRSKTTGIIIMRYLKKATENLSIPLESVSYVKQYQ